MSRRTWFPGFLTFTFCALSLSASAADEHWTRVSSDHFIVLTDAGERRGHEVAARFEQMRRQFCTVRLRQIQGQFLNLLQRRHDTRVTGSS